MCLDKGTYDAISLSPSEAGRKRVCYIESVAALLSAGGLLVITSCNWTAEELKAQFGQSKLVTLYWQNKLVNPSLAN